MQTPIYTNHAIYSNRRLIAMETTPLAPAILVLGPPLVFKAYESEFTKKYNFLKPWKTDVPLHQFISTHSDNVKAILCSAVSPVTGEIVQSLPELRFVLASSIGVNHIDLQECKRRGIMVVNAGSTFSEDVADMAVGLLIDVVRKISACNRLVKNRVCPPEGYYPLTHKLGGKRVGIVGLGNVGHHIATRLNAMGCVISYTSRTMKPYATFPFYTKIHELAANNDILIISCALTEQTHHMINREVMLVLGKEGVIVNIARGAIINEKELVECLVKGEIGGAGLDVFENEPKFPEELFELDNVVLTPHHGAVTEEACRDVYDHICKNLDAFLSNKPLECEVIDM
ncbi:glyoxylate/hydroxypyruvate reductase HPR3-like [Bidens hawaiensis]|uniref:glyoxylate/hydroxypyruvate reductase HPR3-like n=1 Tax=Bidens hawaiensis TaxID=980011 RepID=UPI004048FD88